MKGRRAEGLPRAARRVSQSARPLANANQVRAWSARQAQQLDHVLGVVPPRGPALSCEQCSAYAASGWRRQIKTFQRKPRRPIRHGPLSRPWQPHTRPHRAERHRTPGTGSKRLEPFRAGGPVGPLGNGGPARQSLRGRAIGHQGRGTARPASLATRETTTRLRHRPGSALA